MKKKYIYVCALVLVVAAFIYPPVYNVNARGVRYDDGWAVISDLGTMQQINVPLLITEFVAIGIIAFILIKIFSED